MKNRFLILMLSCSAGSLTAFAEQKEDVLKPYDGPSNPGVDTIDKMELRPTIARVPARLGSRAVFRHRDLRRNGTERASGYPRQTVLPGQKNRHSVVLN